ncbi:MAG: hypothetical protein IPK97_15625 [Ahniella sp.]|nr:hypothetical protein [Ahniella sp.]
MRGTSPAHDPLLDQAEVSLVRDLDLPEAEADLVMDVAAIWRVLDGHEPTSTPFKIQAPGQPWVPVRHERTCGTGQFMALMLSWTTPEPADAWLARNRPDLALSAHLAQHWVENIAELNLPPRLREFAERAFGPERANAEFEAALASVRIESRPLGATAVLSLFGHSLPLPTGEIVYARFRAEGDPPPEPTFYSEMQIAEQLRTAWQASGVEGFLELSDLDAAIEETTVDH